MEVLGSKAEARRVQKGKRVPAGGEVRDSSGWERNRQLPATGSPGEGRGGRLETS